MRYLVFGSANYYAHGGAYDLLFKSDDREEALLASSNLIGELAVYEESDNDHWDDITNEIEWSHVLDVVDNKVIAEFGGKPYGFKCMCIKVKSNHTDN